MIMLHEHKARGRNGSSRVMSCLKQTTKEFAHLAKSTESKNCVLILWCDNILEEIKFTSYKNIRKL